MDLLRSRLTIFIVSFQSADVGLSSEFQSSVLDEFLGYLAQPTAAVAQWVVYGPQIRMSLSQLRAAVRRHIRSAITRTSRTACAANIRRRIGTRRTPRPKDASPSIRVRSSGDDISLTQSGTIGFLTYSEGCNDDVTNGLERLGWTRPPT